MIYKTLGDMLLDNRRGHEAEMKRLGASDEVMKESLQAYDWLASECLKNKVSYDTLRKSIIDKYDEEEADELETMSLKYMNDFLTADAEYFYDVSHQRKVGYSKEESEDA